jgi:hypothetical protein
VDVSYQKVADIQKGHRSRTPFARRILYLMALPNGRRKV